MESVVIKPSFCLNLLNPQTDILKYTSLSFFKFTSKLKRSSISVSYRPHSNPRNPISKYNNDHQPIRSFSILVPVLQSITVLAAKFAVNKWVSVFREFRESEKVKERFNGDYMENGGFGVALLTVTSTSKERISPFVATLASNPTFVSGMLAWVIAQSLKVVLNFFVDRKWDMSIMFASGGMPSSHSALCTALTTSVAICHGVADSLFPVCLGFSSIVMYDAIGVRRHAGMQAERAIIALNEVLLLEALGLISIGFKSSLSDIMLPWGAVGRDLPTILVIKKRASPVHEATTHATLHLVLNMIIEDLFQGHPISKRKLKELLGHTPSQVLAGALLGIVVACICCQGSLAAI